jgi:hypothetical protein
MEGENEDTKGRKRRIETQKRMREKRREEKQVRIAIEMERIGMRRQQIVRGKKMKRKVRKEGKDRNRNSFVIKVWRAWGRKWKEEEG